jgi:hypothetical protein
MGLTKDAHGGQTKKRERKSRRWKIGARGDAKSRSGLPKEETRALRSTKITVSETGAYDVEVAPFDYQREKRRGREGEIERTEKEGPSSFCCANESCTFDRMTCVFLFDQSVPLSRLVRSADSTFLHLPGCAQPRDRIRSSGRGSSAEASGFFFGTALARGGGERGTRRSDLRKVAENPPRKPAKSAGKKAPVTQSRVGQNAAANSTASTREDDDGCVGKMGLP